MAQGAAVTASAATRGPIHRGEWWRRSPAPGPRPPLHNWPRLPSAATRGKRRAGVPRERCGAAGGAVTPPAADTTSPRRRHEELAERTRLTSRLCRSRLLGVRATVNPRRAGSLQNRRPAKRADSLLLDPYWLAQFPCRVTP